MPLPPPAISVVIATYNRIGLLKRLLEQLDRQTIDKERFEVIVIDDGSKEEVPPKLADYRPGYRLEVIRQVNGGAAAARHHGATSAHGDLILFIDDDMQVPEELLAEHLAVHAKNENALVLGRIVPDTSIDMPLFERFHARVLERFASDVASGKVTPSGANVWTGNVSMRRDVYLAIGGFDRSLGRSEDAELGIRMEKAGAKVLLSDEGRSIHGSDHTSLESWLKSSFRYGIFDLRISKKHPDTLDFNPWRYFDSLNPMSRPFLIGALVAPKAARAVSKVAIKIALAADGAGFEKVGLAGCTLVYGIEYARGLREESGGLAGAVEGYADFAEKAGKRTGPAVKLGRALGKLFKS